MRIIDLLAVPEPSFSFEFFPPRTDEGVQALFQTVEALRPLEPSFVSVTYGAGGSTRARTIELVRRIKQELSVETMAHLTCTGATQHELADVLNQLRDAAIENVLCLRGDPPRGQTAFVAVEGGFRYASELTAFVRATWPFCLGTAGYPEKHPESTDRYTDLLHLKEKVAAGASFIVTQLFYDNSYYFEFVAQARRLGISVPIIPGIMPITNVEQIERITSLSGAFIPDRLRKELALRRNDPNAALELGVAYATLQCAELLRRGAPGIHFYTLNKSGATRAILAALRSNPPWRTT
jgi:methylenetetrahydrofolate reductase (NADPH)